MIKRVKIKIAIIILLLGLSIITNSSSLIVSSSIRSEIIPNQSSMKNNFRNQQSEARTLASESKTKPVYPVINILKKGINYVGCQWPGMPWPKMMVEWPLPYWCTIGYNYNYLFEDFWAMKKMGVEHIRLRAEIYPFMIWDNESGYQGFNQTYIDNLEEVFELADSMGFEITFCMMSLVKEEQHPNFDTFYESFVPDSSTPPEPAYPIKLGSVIEAFGDLVSILKKHQSIFSWEIINEANHFAGKKEYDWNYCLEYIFLPIRQEIRDADASRPVLVSFSGLRNKNMQDPQKIMNEFGSICDYYDGHYYNNTVNLPDLTSLDKPIVLGELGAHWENSGPLFHPDRTGNVDTLKAIWNTFEEKGYSSYMPWEFSTFIKTLSNSVVGTNKHCWRWDALTLYSFYTDDDVDFLETNFYVTMFTEPTISGGFMSFKIFIPDLGGYTIYLPYTITSTLRTSHPFYGKPIEGENEGQILNTYFPPPDIPDRRTNGEKPKSFEPTAAGGHFNVTIYGLMHCMELPIAVETNAIETLNFTEYNNQRLVVLVQTGEEAIDKSTDDQENWLTMIIGNYPEILEGQDIFTVVAGETYLVTLKDLSSAFEKSWYVTASPTGELTLNATLISSNQQITITQLSTTATTAPIMPSGITGIGFNYLIAIIPIMTALMIIRKKKKKERTNSFSQELASHFLLL